MCFVDLARHDNLDSSKPKPGGLVRPAVGRYYPEESGREGRHEENKRVRGKVEIDMLED
jgi:hypothetical protein